MNHGRTLRVVIGALIGSVALWAALRGIEAATILQLLATVNLPLALLALTSTLGAVALVAVRWKVLLGGHRRQVTVWMLFRSVMIGQMLNIAMPVRVGELARLSGVATAARLDSGLVLASLALEKVLELVAFMAAAGVLVLFVALPQTASGPLTWVAVPVAGGAVLWAATRYGPRFARAIASLPATPARVRQRLVAFSYSFAAGIQEAVSVRAGAQLLGLSLLIVLLPAAANQLLLEALHLELPVWSGLLLLVVLQVGSVPPSLPGRVGVFNYVIVATLVELNVDRATAASYSIALYLIGYFPKLVLGALFVARPAPRADPTVSGSFV